MAEGNTTSKNDQNNIVKETDHNAKETIGTLDLLTNPMTVEYTTERIERYLGGFMFSHVRVV